jgi:hypothetical protein
MKRPREYVAAGKKNPRRKGRGFFKQLDIELFERLLFVSASTDKEKRGTYLSPFIPSLGNECIIPLQAAGELHCLWEKW